MGYPSRAGPRRKRNVVVQLSLSPSLRCNSTAPNQSVPNRSASCLRTRQVLVVPPTTFAFDTRGRHSEL